LRGGCTMFPSSCSRIFPAFWQSGVGHGISTRSFVVIFHVGRRPRSSHLACNGGYPSFAWPCFSVRTSRGSCRFKIAITRSPRRARECDRERAAGGSAHRVQWRTGDVGCVHGMAVSESLFETTWIADPRGVVASSIAVPARGRAAGFAFALPPAVRPQHRRGPRRPEVRL